MKFPFCHLVSYHFICNTLFYQIINWTYPSIAITIFVNIILIILYKIIDNNYDKVTAITIITIIIIIIIITIISKLILCNKWSEIGELLGEFQRLKYSSTIQRIIE